MSEQAKVRVWLTAIEYVGGNVGSDTEFVLNVNQRTTRIGTNLKVGTRKKFNKLLLEESTDSDQATVAVSVRTVEADAVVDDAGQSEADQAITKGMRRQTMAPLSVTVQENKGLFGRGPTATFIFTFEVEFLATGSVTTCCWFGKPEQTRTLSHYYGQSQQYRRMADYVAGACSYFNLQAAVGHAIGAIEDGVSRPRRWVENRDSSANWFQLDPDLIRNAFIGDYWSTNCASGVPMLHEDDVCRFDVLNAAAGIWYFTSLSSGDFSDDGISYKSAMFRAMQYNWGPSYSWAPSKTSCVPKDEGTAFRPSGYAWTMAFLAWGNGYAVPDIRYTSQYARYPQLPRTGARRWTEQVKYLSPQYEPCSKGEALQVPEFTVTQGSRLTPLGRRPNRQSPRERQIVLVARKTAENTDHDYVSALAVAKHIAATFSRGVAPMVTADAYFACESMKLQNARKAICVIVLGGESRRDIANVFPDAHAYDSFSDWAQGQTDGYVDASTGSSYGANYAKAVQEATAAYRAGY